MTAPANYGRAGLVRWHTRFHVSIDTRNFTTPAQIDMHQNPDRVAEVFHRAVTTTRPRLRYVVGRDARTLAMLRKLLPKRLFLRGQGVASMRVNFRSPWDMGCPWPDPS